MSGLEQKNQADKLVITFWSIAFLAIGVLIAVYRLGFTDFEPLVNFLMLAGITGVLSVLFHYIGGKQSAEHPMRALKKVFGATGIFTIVAWLAFGGATTFFWLNYPTNTIKIGVILPLSGDEAAKGAPILAGMYMGLEKEREDFKIKTGYDLEFVIKDDAFDAQKGAYQISSLINDQKVAAILGPYNTDVAINSIPIVNEHKIALLSSTTTSNCLTAPSAIPLDATKNCTTALKAEYGRDTKAFFRLTASNSEIANVVVKCLGKQVERPLCPQTTKYSKLVILRDDTTYGAEQSVYLAEKWQAEVGSPQKQLLYYVDEPVNEGELPPNIKKDLGSLGSENDPILIFFAGTKQLEKLYDNIRSIPYASFASNSSLTTSQFTKYLDGISTNNPLYASSGEQSIDRGSIDHGTSAKDTQTGVEAFIKEYRENYGRKGKMAEKLEKAAARDGVKIDPELFNGQSPAVSPTSATGYDGARIMIHAIEKAMSQISETDRKTDIGKFREATITNLQGTKQGSQYIYRGVTGAYKGFEADGNIKDYTPVAIYEYSRGGDPVEWRSK